MMRIALTLIALLACSGFLAACGDDDTAADKAAEKIIEGANGGEVDIDSKNGEITVKGKDGATYSSSKKPPKDWPAELALPKSATIVGSTETNQGGKYLMVTGTTKDSAEAFAQSMEGQITGAGWKADEAAVPAGVQGVVMKQYSKGTSKVTISGTASPQGGTAFTVVYMEQK